MDEHMTNHSFGKYWMNISSHSQTTFIQFVNMNYTEKLVHTAHKHFFVFVQKKDKFWLVTSCLLTIRIWFTNLIHINKCVVCKLYTNYSWLDKTTSYSTHYGVGIKICYQKNVELIYHKR